MAPITVAYWDIRGLGQPIRLLLEYTGLEYEDKQYVCGPPPTYDKSCWFSIKESLGLPFPNLPYLIDGDVKLVQTNAIMRYIARKADRGLLGKTASEENAVDLLENQLVDFRSAFSGMCYSPDHEEVKPKYLEALPGKLLQLELFLGSNKFFAGDHPTIVDFGIYEMLDQHKMFQPSCLDKFEYLQGFVSRFEALPRIAEYLKSDRFAASGIKNRLNNRMAKFGSGI